jgi:hypothetical protein
MKKLKLTNKTCGECKNVLIIIDKHEGFYCANCKCLWIKKKDDVMSTNNRPVSKEEFDNLLIACYNAPPIRLKDLKKRLRKEQKEKRQKATI